ncbi:MAG: response regulator transcription factor [Acidobacteriaceae bacterium]|nr:response regulator transcription factor [Acidobacteriaceae bacterium]
MTTILLTSAHPIVRNSLRLLLEREPDFQVLAEAANGREAVVLADYKRPKVVLLDIQLPYLAGVPAAKEILSRNPETAVVFVTAETDEVYVAEAMKAGARAYVSADAAQSDLVTAIHCVAEGGTFVSPSLVSERKGAEA